MNKKVREELRNEMDILILKSLFKSFYEESKITKKEYKNILNELCRTII